MHPSELAEEIGLPGFQLMAPRRQLPPNQHSLVPHSAFQRQQSGLYTTAPTAPPASGLYTTAPTAPPARLALSDYATQPLPPQQLGAGMPPPDPASLGTDQPESPQSDSQGSHGQPDPSNLQLALLRSDTSRSIVAGSQSITTVPPATAPLLPELTPQAAINRMTDSIRARIERPKTIGGAKKGPYNATGKGTGKGAGKVTKTTKTKSATGKGAGKATGKAKGKGKGKAKGKEKKDIIISHEASRKQFLVKVPPGGPHKNRSFPYKKVTMKVAQAQAEAYLEQITKHK